MTANESSANGATARHVMRAVDRAALATVQRDGSGWPYPSLVMTGLDLDGTPLLMVSALAEHTRNLKADSRVGLLFDATTGLDQPLAGARVTVLGRACLAGPGPDLERHRRRYLARHPAAAVYGDFGDFACWRVDMERVHLVAGFGRAYWLDADAVRLGATAVAFLAAADTEAKLIHQLNQDQSALITACAESLAGGASPPAADGARWTVSGLDPDGADLRRGTVTARLVFDRPATSVDELVTHLRHLAVSANHPPAITRA